MIDSQFKVQLTGKIADSILKDLETTTDTKTAKEHLARLQRMKALGYIPRKKLITGLEAIQANSAVATELNENNTITDLMSLHRDTEKAAVELSNNSAMSTKSNNLHLKYDSSQVLLPATTEIDTLGYQGWNKVSGTELENFLGSISPIDGKRMVSHHSTTCHWHPLPWYSNEISLLRLSDPSWHAHNLSIYYLLATGGNLYRMNGTSPPIHEINTKAPIQLNEDNILDYLRFFCFFVRGEEGPFYLLENIASPICQSLKGADIRELIAPHASQAVYKGKDSNNVFQAEGVIYYSNALFKASFAIQRGGMIEMLSDDPILGELPEAIEHTLS